MELKPCPFCGEPGRIEEVGTTKYCGCSSPMCAAYTIVMSVDEWNTRAPSDLEKRIEELEKWLEEAEEWAAIETKCAECYQKGYNAALEEAAQVADGWDFGKPIAEEIRKMKEE